MQHLANELPADQLTIRETQGVPSFLLLSISKIADFPVWMEVEMGFVPWGW